MGDDHQSSYLGLWEVGSNLTGRRIARVIFYISGEEMVLLQGFMKTSRATPLRDLKQEWVSKILQRLDGVLQVRESKYIMLHAPRDALAEITRLLPGSESPTIIPLDGNGDKFAVHAVCRENVFWETLENLKSAGASSLLVIPVEKMLA